MNLSVGYTFKEPNNNYTKEWFDNIYSMNSLNFYWSYDDLPECLYPYIKDKTLPQVCDYTFLKKYVKEFRQSNRAFKKFKHNVHPELRAFISGVRFFQLYNSSEPERRVFQQKIHNAIQLILQTKTYNFGLGLKIAKRDFADEF